MRFLFQDHVFTGIGAGTVSVLCMNPLDLLKVKFQVSTRGWVRYITRTMRYTC